jgi:putative hydrolase of the HAD superfamily
LNSGHFVERVTMQPGIRLVCFDLGGVLVKVAAGWQDACRLGGLMTLPEQGVWERQHTLMQQFECGKIDEAGYFNGVGACGIGVCPEDVVRVFDAWLAGVYPGALELIDELRGRGIVTACLSNTNGRHWRQLTTENADYARLMKKLDHRFASQEMGVAKPDAQAYLHVQRRTGVEAKQIIFFDDRVENVEAALGVGWNSERITAADAIGEQRGVLARYGVL